MAQPSALGVVKQAQPQTGTTRKGTRDDNVDSTRINQNDRRDPLRNAHVCDRIDARARLASPSCLRRRRYRRAQRLSGQRQSGKPRVCGLI